MTVGALKRLADTSACPSDLLFSKSTVVGHFYLIANTLSHNLKTCGDQHRAQDTQLDEVDKDKALIDR